MTISWTLETAPGDYTLGSGDGYQVITWSPSLGLFCAAGDAGSLGSGAVITSPDGVTWTAQTIPANDDNGVPQGICWSPELSLFAVSLFTGSTQGIMTSPDGVTWTLRATPDSGIGGGGFLWDAICWSPELSLFSCIEYTGATCMTSPDGVNWTQHSFALPGGYTGALVRMCWSSSLGIFLAACAFNADETLSYICTSSDGSTWSFNSVGVDNNIEGCAWSPSLGLFAVPTQLSVATSPDGATWTIQDTAGFYNLLDVVWGENQFLLVDASGIFMQTSPDGINWTLTNSVPTTDETQWDSGAWSPSLGRFCITGTQIGD